LLKSIDTQLGLTKRLAACVDDARQPAKVRHETTRRRIGARRHLPRTSLSRHAWHFLLQKSGSGALERPSSVSIRTRTHAMRDCVLISRRRRLIQRFASRCSGFTSHSSVSSPMSIRILSAPSTRLSE
jgi:hypothetical protein